MQKIISSSLIALAIVIAMLIGANGIKNRNSASNSINVTGLGKKDFTSDLVVWTGSFSKISYVLKEAYEMLNKDQQSIKAYLKDKGINEDEIVFSAVDINKEFNYTYDAKGNQNREFNGYRLTQLVEIESKEIEKIEAISRTITEIINFGVEFYSNQPQYYYTQLSELKIQMIAAATEDARIRAEQIAEKSGSALGNLHNASMGVFQIIGQNSNEDYSWGGSYNTSSKMKTATITMKLEFGVE